MRHDDEGPGREEYDADRLADKAVRSEKAEALESARVSRKEYEGDRSADRAERAEKAEAIETVRTKPKPDEGPGRKEYEGDRSADRAERLSTATGLAEEVAERRKDPGPSGTEFAEYKSNDRLRAILSLLVLVGVLSLAVFSVINALNDTDRDDSIAVCEDNRESIQRLYANELQDLAESEKDPGLRKAFAHLSDAEWAALIADERQFILRARADVSPDECEELFE